MVQRRPADVTGRRDFALLRWDASIGFAELMALGS